MEFGTRILIGGSTVALVLDVILRQFSGATICGRKEAVKNFRNISPTKSKILVSTGIHMVNCRWVMRSSGVGALKEGWRGGTTPR
jgi:hypothetical protein